jgi:ribosome-binding protein aMBF1 (putative translation factor)
MNRKSERRRAADRRLEELVTRYATDWGRMRRTGLSRADLLRRFLEEVQCIKTIRR